MKAVNGARDTPAHRSSPGVARDHHRRRSLKIRRVLVPVDFSVASLQALEFAVPLSKRFVAELHLIHVLEPDYPLAATAAMPLIIPELEAGRRIRRFLKHIAHSHGVELHRENIHCLNGRPFEKICDLARDSQVDLIVIATRGNTGLKHLALGSTAERVVRYSPCPVLVVRGASQNNAAFRNGNLPPGSAMKQILVPIDFSDCSMKSLTFATALAREFGAKLLLLHSVHLPYYVANDEYGRYDFPMLMQQQENAASKMMRDLMQNTSWHGTEVQSSLQSGHAGDQICAQAKDNGVDVIVLATHGRTGLKHAFIGSTAEYVVRHAQCPVLVVPTRERPLLRSTKTQL